MEIQKNTMVRLHKIARLVNESCAELKVLNYEEAFIQFSPKDFSLKQSAKLSNKIEEMDSFIEYEYDEDKDLVTVFLEHERKIY